MPARRTACRDCGRHVTRCGKLSRAGLCVECGIARAVAAATSMHERSGPAWEHWLASPALKGDLGIPSSSAGGRGDTDGDPR